MTKRLLVSALLLALIAAGIWSWLGAWETGREPFRAEDAVAASDPRPGGPALEPEPRSPALADAPPIPRVAVDQPVDPARAPRLDDSAADELASAIVLVIDQSTRRPMGGVQVLPRTGSTGTYGPGQSRSRGRPWQALHTDEDGRVVVEAPPLEEVRIAAHGERGRAGSASAKVVMPAAGTTVEVVLEIPTADDLPFWMQLVDDETREPLPGIEVTADPGQDRSETLKSDSRGLIFAQCRTWSRSRFHVAVPGRAEMYWEPAAGHELAADALVIGIPRSANLRVRVVDAGGTAVADALVKFTTEGYQLAFPRGITGTSLISLPDPRWESRTDAQGLAALDSLPPLIPLHGAITKPRAWSSAEHVVLVPGETREIEWKLTDGCSLSGIVIDQNGAPVASKQMWLRKAERNMPAYFNSYSSDETRTTTTDEAGRFSFSAVSPGKWWVGPAAPARKDVPGPGDVAALAEPIEIEPSRTDLEVVLRVDRGLFIRGRVLDSKGQPSTSGHVRAYERDRKLNTGCDVNASEFVIGPLMAGEYHLVARAARMAEAPSEELRVAAGTEGVVLRLRAGGSLRGLVVDDAGKALATSVTVSRRDPGAMGPMSRSPMPDGTFHFQGLEPGRYDISTATADARVGILEDIEIAAGQEVGDLVVRLMPGGTVRVRHEGPEKFANIRLLHRGIQLKGDGLERSAAREFVVPAGTILVRMSYHEADLRTAERSIDVVAGQRVEVVFEPGAR